MLRTPSRQGLFVLLVGLSALGAVDAPPSLDGLLTELKRLYPDRESVQANSQQVAQRLLRFAEAREPSSPGSPGGERGGIDGAADRGREVDRARLLAAEVLFLGGASSEAKRVLNEVADGGSSDDGRARALYLLGEQLFFQERYVPESAPEGKPKPSAYQYWSALDQKYPDSIWSRRAAVPLRYLRLLKGEPLLPFHDTFHALGRGLEKEGDLERSSEEFLGKVLVLDFWKSSTPGQKDFEIQLATDMKSNIRTYPDLKGRVEILGVNLDSRTVDFARAVSDWSIPWPQHHDSLGFETPLARFFGIPRGPHLVVLDPEGHLAYMGADRNAFFRALTRELRRVRGVEEKK